MVVKTTNEYSSNDFYRLYDNSWSGALQTLEDIKNADLEEEFMEHLEQIFSEDEIEDTQLNDYIWFDRDQIYESLGLDSDGKIIEEEECEL